MFMGDKDMPTLLEEVDTVICKYCGSDNCMKISKETDSYVAYVCRECGRIFEVEDERD